MAREAARRQPVKGVAAVSVRIPIPREFEIGHAPGMT